VIDRREVREYSIVARLVLSFRYKLLPIDYANAIAKELQAYIKKQNRSIYRSNSLEVRASKPKLD
jgi:hypothetical protein